MLYRNKMPILLIAIVFSLALSACSGGSQKQPSSDIKDSGSQTIPPAQENTDNASSDDQSSEDAQLNIAVGETAGKSAALPDSYPSDLFPVYKDSYIVSAVELEGSYTITAFSKDDFKKVASFYKDVLKNATVTYEADTDTGFTSFGTVGNMTYNFDTGASSEMEGYVSSIAILLMPAK